MDWLHCRIVIYIDGPRFGAHHIIRAVVVDREGRKHILGLEAVASSVLQLMHGISSALDNRSIRCFANTGIDFSITEV